MGENFVNIFNDNQRAQDVNKTTISKLWRQSLPLRTQLLFMRLGEFYSDFSHMFYVHVLYGLGTLIS